MVDTDTDWVVSIFLMDTFPAQYRYFMSILLTLVMDISRKKAPDIDVWKKVVNPIKSPKSNLTKVIFLNKILLQKTIAARIQNL